MNSVHLALDALPLALALFGMVVGLAWAVAEYRW